MSPVTLPNTSNTALQCLSCLPTHVSPNNTNYIRSSSLSSGSSSSKYVFLLMVTLVFFSICELTYTRQDKQCNNREGKQVNTPTKHARVLKTFRAHQARPRVNTTDEPPLDERRDARRNTRNPLSFPTQTTSPSVTYT